MIFDLHFVNLELKAAKDGTVPPALFTDPVFQAIAFHEAAMNRPALDEARLRSYFAAAAADEDNCWGLSMLFRRRKRVERILALLEEERELITDVIEKWLRIFTSAPQAACLRCVPYVGTYDGGFKLEGENETVYLNIPAISCREAFYETLAHESFHARQRSPQADEKIRLMEGSSNYLEAVLYFTFEEGIAEFIGYNGFTTSKYPILRLRAPEEGSAELKDLLRRYREGLLTGAALYHSFRAGDCCYTAGVAIASAVWAYQGREGLDLWAVRYDEKAFYEAFRNTPTGQDWPALDL